jgi:hypothetical protein
MALKGAKKQFIVFCYSKCDKYGIHAAAFAPPVQARWRKKGKRQSSFRAWAHSRKQSKRDFVRVKKAF